MLLMNAGKAVAAGGGGTITFDSGTATAVTLSNGNLTATNTGTTSADQGAKALSAKASGKWYLEYTITTQQVPPGGNVGCGVGTNASTYTGMGNDATSGGMVFIGSGNVYGNGSFSSLSLGARSQGNVLGVAVDLDNHKIWFRVCPSGNWNGQTIGFQDPASNVGGVTIPSASLEPFVTFGGSSGQANNALTANFGGSAFNGTAPTGFTSWQ